MSVHVSSAVLRHSKAKLGKRLVMLVLADAAGEDGVTWIDQTRIAAAALLSQAHVRDCLRELEAEQEVETRKAQVGRKRINVYRLRLPGLAPIDLERLPFKLTEPFSDDRGNPAVVPDDDRGFAGATTAGLPSPTRGRGSEPLVEPLEGSEASPPRAEQAVSVRKPNLPFDALIEVCPGTDPTVDGGMVAKALKEIRQRIEHEVEHRGEATTAPAPSLRTGAAHDHDGFEKNDPRDNAALANEIRHRADLYRQRWPEAELTPSALAKHFTRVALPKASGQVKGADVLRDVDWSKVGASPPGDQPEVEGQEP